MSLKGKGFFSGVDSVITGKSLAGIRGVVREDSILLRIHYLKRSLKEPSYTEYHVIDKSATAIHKHLNVVGIYTEFDNVLELVKEQYKLQNTGLTRFEPSSEGKRDLDEIDEQVGNMSREESDYEEEPDSDILFTKEIVIPKSSIITYLERDSRLPFSTMQKMHEKVLEYCSPFKTFRINKENSKEFFYYWSLFKDVKHLPAEDGQPKKYRFKIDENPLLDIDDYFEGMKELVSMFENDIIA